MNSLLEDVVLITNIKRHIDEDINMNILATKYLPMFEKLVLHYARSYNRANIDPNDYLIYFTIALNKSVKKYDPTLGSYKTFLNQILAKIVSKEMLRQINFNDPMNTFVSFDSIADGNLSYHEVVADDTDLSPQEYTNINEVKLMLRSDTQMLLSTYEEQRLRAINMRIFGYKIKDIAEKLGLSYTTVRRMLESIDEDGELKNIKVRLK